MTRAVVELEDVAKIYPGSPPVAALQPSSLTITEGSYTAIVGPSGSGKSTLLTLLGLLCRPSSGVVLVDGNPVQDLSDGHLSRVRAQTLGFVFQSFHLLPSRTAVENVELPLIYERLPANDRTRIALQLLDRVGLAHRAHALPRHLSGGERQRVALARALVNRPQVLLCDEPTGNLDSASAENVMDILADLHRDGVAVVLVTHNESLTTAADKVIEVRDGFLGSRPTG